VDFLHVFRQLAAAHLIWFGIWCLNCLQLIVSKCISDLFCVFYHLTAANSVKLYRSHAGLSVMCNWLNLSRENQQLARRFGLVILT
jgi:hypothetical protein